MSAAAPTARARPPEGVRRLLGGLRPDGLALGFEAHVRRYGVLPPVERDPHGFVELVGEAGLRGCGGAGFPTGDKLAAVMAGRGRPVVVANGAEGEPPSGKDKVLLAYAPQLVLDGAVLAARATGAREVFVAVGQAVRANVEHAIAERWAAGGERKIALRTVVVPDRFVSGEETALVQLINGGPCLPAFTPPRPFERGVGGAPTLVQNVETLANLALIARFGAGWFRSVGTDEEPGSALVTLSGAVRRPGVHEVPYGFPLRDLVAASGGPTAEIQAFLVGGLFGSWIAAGDAAGARLSRRSLAPLGAAPGARAIFALPSTACGVAETARIARYLAIESAGQCGPCVHGLASLAEGLEQLAYHGRRVEHAVLRRRLAAIRGRGACRHPDGAVAVIDSALRVFESEFDDHERAGECSGTGRPVLALPIRRARAAG